MTPIRFNRPAFVALGLALPLLAACGQGEPDPHRFEKMARLVADIEAPLDPALYNDAPSPSRTAGLRPAMSPLQVELMTPHELWDARDGVVREAVVETAPVLMEQAAVATAGRLGLSSEPEPASPPAASEGRVIQLGAYASEREARLAWARVADREALAGFSPILQVAEVNGRRWVRLRIGPVPTERAGAVCAAAGVDDPWCRAAA
ncbi:SPOR domain-containing protein [Brevundimonas sp. S30B]|uniref:SPOR domain-containing protein n=1 Tax=unclassified Brevundimonas TaxID=2622653 RepID=UPI001072A478|nr:MULTISPECIES: SPOR domain-containing protein [unclassified Brevundimonas]QBX37739.1 SPOR domain-containing protein [Brevundimonas sp. MF30-B]TFW02907.1 SPOR domain-containing protein [Brevundimonas sp. S30B]